MSKLDLNDIGNILTAVSTINQNNARIEAAMEKTLFRDGTSPNEMNAALDMNNYRIYNLPKPTSSTEPLRLQDISDYLDDISVDVVTLTYSTVLEASFVKVPSSAKFIQTAGYYSAGDGGGALYKLEATEPATLGGKFQLYDGRWAVLASSERNVKQFGVRADGVTDDTAAFATLPGTESPGYPWQREGVILPAFSTIRATIDWSDRSRVCQLYGHQTVIKKPVDDGKPLFQISNDGEWNYLAPNFIEGLIFDADNKADFGVLCYNTARWRWTNCTARQAKRKNFLQMGGAHCVWDRFDSTDAGEDGLAFDGFTSTDGTLTKAYPNAHRVLYPGLFDNKRYGLYFDQGRQLEIIGGDIEGNGTDGESISGGIGTGAAVGLEFGDEVRSGVTILGSWIEGNKGTKGAVNFLSGVNKIAYTKFIANGTNADISPRGGVYRIDNVDFSGFRSYVVEESGVGYGNGIANCTIGTGSFDVNREKTALYGDAFDWTDDFVPFVGSDNGSMAGKVTVNFFSYTMRGKETIVTGSITVNDASGHVGPMYVTSPIECKHRVPGSLILSTGLPGAIASTANSKTLILTKADGTTFIANGAEVSFQITYTAAN